MPSDIRSHHNISNREVCVQIPERNESKKILMRNLSDPDISSYSALNVERENESVNESLILSNQSQDIRTNINICRKSLPAPTSSLEGVSFLRILRNNFGKDLNSMTIPIVLNEPISLLQKQCEELEYAELLDSAANSSDEIERMSLVAAFVVSGYSSTQNRAARKPFNPLLGETFEYVCPRFRFLAEKVSHQPPIIAMHSDSKNFVYYQDSKAETKYLGNKMDLKIIGVIHLIFPRTNEHYTWKKPATSLNNMFSADKYLEHHGVVKIQNETSGLYCVLNFQESGFLNARKNEVNGDIYKPSGAKVSSIWKTFLKY